VRSLNCNKRLDSVADLDQNLNPAVKKIWQNNFFLDRKSTKWWRSVSDVNQLFTVP